MVFSLLCIEISRTVMKKKMRILNHQSDIRSNSMDIFDGRYYNINKRLLSFIGQWPYQSVSQKYIRFCLIVILSCTGLGPQMRSIILTWGRLDTFVACFTPILANVGSIGKLVNSTYYSQELKQLLNAMRKDWDLLEGIPQIKILQKHAEKGRTFTILHFSVCYVVIFSWILTPLVPKMLDIFLPLNHSRQRLDIFPTDYMVDPDEHFYPIYFHLATGSVIILLIPIAVDTFYMCIAQHVCGMFEILRHDLENILQEDNDNSAAMLNLDNHDDTFYDNIVSCIKRHKGLIEYVKIIQSTCEWMLIMIVWVCVCALSFTGYQTVANTSAMEDVIRMELFVVAQIFHLYILTLPSHWIAHSSSFLPISAYNCRWYRMSVKSRKLILLIMRASIEPCYIIAGKIYIMSIENFCSVLRTSVSYLTMLTSIQ